ncbi:hypothetical protein H257_16715 [Aphanomyces astaci]|uniref:Calponin-homology (CH) domain-containing protein n=1 Tax=Aphanomyces astaci TaxID=112090 RepID=W4FHB1_APHAT|nr:hypothetical protein H257_16715 [Aphanomyces astaci]ETV66907.1 hypothetical protein H257_16715 [Aphanomyces astaci]|eukprot:XP_009843548.1 hypothetical protein H257_16715 [Aphanomyces astaci]
MDLNHKLNRERSSSAKWASDVHLAVEYLKRQHEVIEWLQHAMDRPMPTHDLQELLKSGVVLRELMAILAPTSATPKPIARTYSATMAPWKERENISVFLTDCRRLGMSECSLFGTDDLYEGTNMVQVMFGMQYIKAWFTGGVRSPRSPKNSSDGVWSFSESQVQDVVAQFQKHKSQGNLLQGYLTRHESNSDVSTLREPEPASEVTTKEPAVFGDVRIQSVGLPASPSTSDLHAVSDNTIAVNHTHHEQVEAPASSSPTTRDDDEAMGTPTEQYVLATTPILTDPPSDQVSSHTAILPSVQLNAISDDAAVPQIDPSMHRVRYGCCCRVM